VILGEGITDSRIVSRFKTIESECSHRHDSKYTYNKSVFLGMGVPFVILCPFHGEFKQTPYNHGTRGLGCKKCADVLNASNRTIPKLDAVKMSKKVHGENTFDYGLKNKLHYTNMHTKWKLTCNKCGFYFEQLPSNNIHSKHGCPRCAKLGRVVPLEDLIERSKEIHGESTFDYSGIEESKYTNTRSEWNLTCNKCGYVFKQTANRNVSGKRGCARCARNRSKYWIYKDKPTTLYYVKISDCYKIGLTQTSVKQRYSKELSENLDIKPIHEWYFEDGYCAYLIEQHVLELTAKYHVQKSKSPIKSGWTEIRTVDIQPEIIYCMTNQTTSLKY